MYKVLVTGANGFVGKNFSRAAVEAGYKVRIASRNGCDFLQGVESVIISSIDGGLDWTRALEGIDVVVHLAARVHVMRKQSSENFSEYLVVNYHGTKNLASQAAALGVKRFIYLSSVKAMGEDTDGRAPYSEVDIPMPKDSYGHSKLLAESSLFEIAKETSMEVVIVRPPMIYGAGVKGNFYKIVQAVRWSMPLPINGFSFNSRSLVGIDNLTDFMLVCCRHPLAANNIFLVGDDQDLSTREIFEKIATALKSQSYNFYFPVGLIKILCVLFAAQPLFLRLSSSLQIDITKAKSLLGWSPKICLADGFSRAVVNVRHRRVLGKRFFDIAASSLIIILISPLMMMIAFLIKLEAGSPVLFWSERVGEKKVIFKMPKFRTMKYGAPVVATHLMKNPAQYITKIGSFLRRSSLDELPQLWSILIGDMSFVGPRPALFDQVELIELRDYFGVSNLIPGLTGWAQVNGRDEISIPVKVQYEVEYLQSQSFWFDMKILGLTFIRVIRRAGVSH